VIVTPEVSIANLVQETGCGVVAAGDPANLGLEMKRLLDNHERRREWGTPHGAWCKRSTAGK
jgi:hypothetical protein